LSQALTDLDADSLSRAIHARQVSCREVMAATLARIERLNPRFNAIVSLAPADRLLRQADERDAELARGRSRGWLHGIPQAIKDAAQAVGFPTTLGSPLFADAVASQDSLFVARMKAAGCIVIGKTNMPELGLGSHTFNDLFGPTGNAWDPRVSAGGSSGGAAVALAHRLLPVADGSDFMGSLRNPAGWNHVFGMRPSQGRVPSWPRPEIWIGQLATEGPMGLRVRDVARLLEIQSGGDVRAPLSTGGKESFVPARDATARGARIAWLGDLDGHLALASGIRDVCEQALERLEGQGARVEPAGLGFDADRLWEAWLVWRRALVAPLVGALISREGSRARIKPEALWEHDCAQEVSAADLMSASTVRSAFYAQLLTLFERFDALALPVAQVWPFDVRERWPKEIAGRAMDTYHRWMEVTIYATLGGLPAISVPAGFDADGRLPMGLQLIGRPQGDAELLRLAAAYEAAAEELLSRRPPE
jgi:amidase